MLIQLLPSSTVAAGVRVNNGSGGTRASERLQAQSFLLLAFLAVCIREHWRGH